MADDDRLRRDLADIEARITAVSTRLSLDYGSDETREGWRDWLVQLRRKRDAIAALIDAAPTSRGDERAGPDGAGPPRSARNDDA